MTADARFWNKIAAKYARQPVADPDAFDRKITLTKSRMTPNDVLLDIGCGTGSLALRLASNAAHVHGLDISSEMVRIAEGKAAAQKVDNVTFHTGACDTGLTSFDAGRLDGICAYSILHLVNDLPGVLSQIFTLLKPGGFFISSTVCLGESWVPFAPLLKMMRWIGKAPSVSILSKRRLKDDIRRAGFVDLSLPDVGAKKIVAFILATKPTAGA